MRMNIFRLPCSLFFITIILVNCNNKIAEQWDEVTVNHSLSKDKTFAQMGLQPEIMPYPGQDSTLKRSSEVAFLVREGPSRQDPPGTKDNNCEAFFMGTDTLHIHIGLNGLLGGSGFRIKYHNNRFYTEGYRYSDMVYQGKVDEPLHWVVYQKLSLDKSSYNIGDSLYGYIDFKAMERNEIGDTLTYSGHGKFRTSVIKKQIIF
ncbi:hypothetical protein [Pedobacter sp. Bi36]|uniref:hypothetical protein n=2 Tax=unclassified Pedobacter TaxID=2628915 RepID=UPI001E3BEBF9|nr:hypothetical protein [Pedobacter sp. Bi36]